MNTDAAPPVAPGMKNADEIGRQLRLARGVQDALTFTPFVDERTPEEKAEDEANEKKFRKFENFFNGVECAFWVLLVLIPACAYVLKWLLDNAASLVRTIFG